MNNSSGELDLLIQRLRARAADPERRTESRPSVFDERARSLDLGGLLLEGLRAGNDLRRIVAANRQGVVPADLAARAEQIAQDMNTPAPSSLSAPASEASLRAAESQLRFALPPLLRRLYGEVADGGFGPSTGLLPVSDLLELHSELAAGDSLPRGRQWPGHLLPIVQENPAIYCVDASSEEERVVVWDPDGLEEYASAAAWSRSFSEESPSLREWLAQWLDGPTPEERFQAQFGDQIRAAELETARRSRAMIAAMSPEERAAMGLPEVGWEQIVWGGLGWDPDENSG